MLNMALMGAYQIVTALFGFVLPSMILNTYGASLHGYTTTVSNIGNRTNKIVSEEELRENRKTIK